MYNFDINVAEFGNTIEVDMGECKFLASDSKDVLFTKGLGPCVGVSVVIKTIDGKVYRLLAHVIMEYKEEEPFEELKACSKQMKKCINTNIESIAISFTTSCSYCNRGELSSDEFRLLTIVSNAFGVNRQKIHFNHESQVIITPDGSISTDLGEIEKRRKR